MEIVSNRPRPRLGLMTAPSDDRTHVLVVEDDPDIAGLIRVISESQGYSVMTAGTAPEAWERIHDRMPDLVSADLMMPGQDGYELVARLRSTPETKDIGIVILSARAGAEDRARGFAAGCDDYVVKPFDAKHLLTIFDAVAELAKARRTGR